MLASITRFAEYIGASILVVLIVLTFFFFSGIVHSTIRAKTAKKKGPEMQDTPFKIMFASLTAPVLLPENSSRRLSLYMPPLAFAALMPATAGISFFLFIPLLTDMRDLLQVAQFILMSDFFAATALFSLGTVKGRREARRLVRLCIRFYIPFVACLALVAFYTHTSGIFGDPFNILILSSHFSITSMTPFGVVGCALLLFVLMALLPFWGGKYSDDPLFHSSFEDYDGPQSAMLQLWAMFRSFLATALVIYIFFPWPFLRDVYSNTGSAWPAQAFAFCSFWFLVILVRNIGAPASAAIIKITEDKLGERLAPFLSPILVLIAVLLLIYEAFRAATEIL